MLLSLIDSYFEDWSTQTKVPSDQLRLVFALLINFPLAYVFLYIRSIQFRYIISLALGIIMQYFVYREEIVHPLALTTITYFMTKYYKGEAATPVFIVSFIYLSGYHFHRMYVDYGGWTVDASFVLMIFLTKYTSFACCVDDGTKRVEDLSADQNARKIVEFPTVDQYFSYIFFFPTSICGPTYDYMEFYHFITRTGQHRLKYNPLFEAVTTLLFGILMFGAVAFIAPLYPFSFCITEEYANYGILRQILGFNLAGYCSRMKYYAGFYLAQASVDASGLSFNGYDAEGHAKYDKIVGVDIKLELADNPKFVLDNWNKQVQLWLKRYVYFRYVSEKDIKSNPRMAEQATLITFIASAFWHGFYPVYYIGFFNLFLLLQTSRYIYKASWKFRNIPEPLAYVIRFVLTFTMFNFFGAGFQLLEIGKALTFFKITWYIPTILVATYLFFIVTRWGQKKPAHVKRDDVIIKDETEEYHEEKLREKLAKLQQYYNQMDKKT